MSLVLTTIRDYWNTADPDSPEHANHLVDGQTCPNEVARRAKAAAATHPDSRRFHTTQEDWTLYAPGEERKGPGFIDDE